MPQAKWHYSVNGQSFGPAAKEDIVARVRSGQLKPTDYVWCEGMGNWETINSIAEFQDAMPAAAGLGVPPRPPGARRSHEIDYEIIGDDLQVVEVELDPGEVVIAEAGAMNYMDDGISFEARFGDGTKPDQGFWGKVLEAGKRKLTGESLFLTHFTNAGSGKKRVAFAAPYPGKIVPLHLDELGGEVICQKDAFLCAALGTEVGIAFARRLGVGLFGGEGFILQRLRGDGLAFVHAGGTIVKRDMKGEKLLVDTGCLVAFTQGIEYDIEQAGNLRSMIFGGEGLFLATLRGHGTVWLQTLPFARLANRIIGAIRGTGGTAKGEGSVLGGLSTLFEQ